MPVDDGRIRNPIGANMSVRADVMRRTGPFAAELGRSYVGSALGGTADETEFCIRASRLHPGGYWLHRPHALVRHTVPPQRATWAYFVRRCRLEGRSKAAVSDLAGTDAALSSERAYTRSVLPRAVLRELTRGARGDRAGFQRAAAIVAGLAITALEYGRVRATRRLRARGGPPR
jgi:hypothetical protein